MGELMKEQEKNLQINGIMFDLNPTDMRWNSSSYAPPPPPPPNSVPILISFQNYSSSYNLHPHDDYNTSNSIRVDDEMTPQMLNFSSSSADGQCNSSGITGATRSPLQAQDHLLAERKRREKLAQLFLTLSKLVPALKKLDKASILEDAINYLKSLQDRVRILEEQAAEIIIIKSNNKDHNDDDSHNWVYEAESESTAEIKARILKGQVLIKIYCKNQRNGTMRLVSNIPTEVEKMNLRVIDMRVMPFGVGGAAALDITILAQQQHKSDAAALKDIVAHLQALWFSPPASCST